MECYLLSELKVRDCRKCMLSLWLKKCILGALEQKLVDLVNTIHWNSWLTGLQREELERNLAKNDSWKEAEKSADTGNKLPVLCKFKTHSIIMTKKWFYTGAVVDTNRFRVKINKVAERNSPMWRRKL